MQEAGHVVPSGKVRRTMPPPLKDAFLSRARVVTCPRRKPILDEGSLDTSVFLLLEGRIQYTRIAICGRELILREAGPGELFGELSAIDGLPRFADVVAATDCSVAVMPGSDFTRMLREVPDAALWLARMLTATIRDMSERAFELATLPVASRIQAELMRLVDECGKVQGDSARISPLPTQADLASRLGTSRESVSRELSQLAQGGLVLQSGRTLHIRSLAALRSLAVSPRRG